MSSFMHVDGKLVARTHYDEPPGRTSLPEQLRYALGQEAAERWRGEFEWRTQSPSANTLLWAVQLAPCKAEFGEPRAQESKDLDNAIFVLRTQDKLTFVKIGSMVGLSAARVNQRYQRRLRSVTRFLATYGRELPRCPIVSVTRAEADLIQVFTDLLLEGAL